jgi:hypothetical protein
MSTAVQLSFLPDKQAELLSALQTYQESGVTHLSFVRFVRELAIKFKSAGPGACLVAACPNGQTISEAIASLKDEIRARELQHYGVPSDFRLVEISVPSRVSHRQLELELFDRYRHALNSVRISHRCQPQFGDLNLGDYNARTAMGRLIAFLSTKKPSLVVIRDTENLDFPGASPDDIRAGWRMLMDIASQSRVPHLIFAPPVTVSSVVYDDPVMLGKVTPAILKPYHSGKNGNMECFHGVLNDYNAPMPWEGTDNLGEHLSEIDEAIAGNVDRLQQWIVQALNCALCEPETTRVSWRHFQETKPHANQQRLAHDERKEALAMLELSDKSIAESVKRSDWGGCAVERLPKIKPGTQKPERKRLMTPAVVPE